MRHSQPAFVPRYSINEGRGMSNRFIICGTSRSGKSVLKTIAEEIGNQLDFGRRNDGRPGGRIPRLRDISPRRLTAHRRQVDRLHQILTVALRLRRMRIGLRFDALVSRHVLNIRSTLARLILFSNQSQSTTIARSGFSRKAKAASMSLSMTRPLDSSGRRSRAKKAASTISEPGFGGSAPTRRHRKNIL